MWLAWLAGSQFVKTRVFQFHVVLNKTVKDAEDGEVFFKICGYILIDILVSTAVDLRHDVDQNQKPLREPKMRNPDFDIF